jgi:hypothetical protein
MRLGLPIITALFIGLVLGTILLMRNALHAPLRLTASSTLLMAWPATLVPCGTAFASRRKMEFALGCCQLSM